MPARPWKFFKNLFECLGENVQLFLAKCDGEIIGGGIQEYYGTMILSGYVAADPSQLKKYPYNAINWASIEDACQKGYGLYDFERASYDNEGLVFFKTRWRIKEKKLFYSSWQLHNPE